VGPFGQRPRKRDGADAGQHRPRGVDSKWAKLGATSPTGNPFLFPFIFLFFFL
jgi:hypothetical protein